ncbi:cuticle protein 19.8-like [Lepeophtheirus salmonis]|uniref:cuticle protein 19.8-like n=1 Tax=Lepeophtheirus salmonis TaxID=72036 RepID=UPI003AF37739
MFAKILIACLAVNIALVASAPNPPPSYSSYPPPPPPPPAQVSYGYNYGVVDDESGVNMSADELAENGVVSGSYKVVLPDGRMKIVTYTVEGDSGFVADVQFEAAPVPAAAALPPYPKYTPYPV